MLQGFNGNGDVMFTGADADQVDIEILSRSANRIFTGSGKDVIYAGTRDVITGGSDDDWFRPKQAMPTASAAASPSIPSTSEAPSTDPWAVLATTSSQSSKVQGATTSTAVPATISSFLILNLAKTRLGCNA